MPVHETPKNPTEDPYRPRGEWGYTVDAQEEARLRNELERRAGVKERPTIGQDTPISGGVYEGLYGGEAIVVDTEKYHEGYDRAMALITSKIAMPDGSYDKNRALMAVFGTVSETMRYDQSAVDEIFRTVGRGMDKPKIALERYVLDGVGVCRHQALFAAQLLEGLKEMGILTGKVSIDRNQIRTAADKADGHAWVRYTSSSGQVFIIDIAQQRAGTLEEFMKEREDSGTIWDYGRDEDHARKDIEKMLNDDTVERVDLKLVADADSGELREQFDRKKASLIDSVSRAIETAGHIDPCMSASRLIYDIEGIMRSEGLSEEALQALRESIATCREIVSSGTHTRSRYHRNEAAGLAHVKRIIQSVSY